MAGGREHTSVTSKSDRGPRAAECRTYGARFRSILSRSGLAHVKRPVLQASMPFIFAGFDRRNRFLAAYLFEL
jgi:hypothetical protein